MKFDPAKLRMQLSGKGMGVYDLQRAFLVRGKKITPEAIYGWVSGRSAPNADNLILLAQLLECRPEDFYASDISIACDMK